MGGVAIRSFTQYIVGRSSLHGEPRQEQAVRLDIFPIGNEAAGHLAADAAQESFELFAREPFFPLGSFEASPLLRIFVDNRDAPAGLDYAADLTHSLPD